MKAPHFTYVILPFLCTACGQSEPPMPRSTFEAAAKLCHLNATTYTPEKWMGLDEPLIDFRAERDWRSAERCFNTALNKVDDEMTARAHAQHVGYIWGTLPAENPGS